MSSNKFYIYAIQNPDGKRYVGSTSCMKRRMNQYKNLHHKHQRKIVESIVYHGWESHSVSILLECKEEQRFYWEAYFGHMLNCIGENGLNLSLPSVNDEWNSTSDETRKLIGMSKKGSIPWNKGIAFLKGEDNPMYGVKRSDEWKAKHSLRSMIMNKKGADHFRSKVVLNLESGIFYDTCKEASVSHCIPYSTLKQRLRKGSAINLSYI
jgi:group I intron endonuclease